MKPITHISVQFSVWIDEDNYDVHVRFTGFDNEEDADLFAIGNVRTAVKFYVQPDYGPLMGPFWGKEMQVFRSATLF